MRISELICLGPKQKYFCERGWTGKLAKHEVICPSGKSAEPPPQASSPPTCRSSGRTNFATNAPHEKPNRKFKVSWFDARRGGHQMRRERRATPEGAGTITYTFHFQISSN